MPVTPRRLRYAQAKHPVAELLVISPTTFVEYGEAIRRELAAGSTVLSVANGELAFLLLPGPINDEALSAISRFNRGMGWRWHSEVIHFEHLGRDIVASIIRFERRPFDDQLNDFVKHAIDSLILVSERMLA